MSLWSCGFKFLSLVFYSLRMNFNWPKPWEWWPFVDFCMWVSPIYFFIDLGIKGTLSWKNWTYSMYDYDQSRCGLQRKWHMFGIFSITGILVNTNIQTIFMIVLKPNYFVKFWIASLKFWSLHRQFPTFIMSI